MCKIFDEIRNEGIEQGIEQGREQGAAKNVYANVNTLMETLGVSFEEALKILKISKEEYLEGKRLTEEEEN